MNVQECNLCGYTTAKASNFKRHLKKHDVTSTEQQCKTYNYRTARADNFINHEKKHAENSRNEVDVEMKHEIIREAIRNKFEYIRHRPEPSMLKICVIEYRP